ncbi:MAG TPA: methylmalonyl-CoA mutase family protein, partial [Beijerinckiaceae bacterium]|nr:methylmalonyl-CoA mutase family protein [Beijerinckiaceae bacterium]
MSRIPNFSTVALASPAERERSSRRRRPGEGNASPYPNLLPQAGEGAQPWLTPEGIAVKGRYGPEDRADIDFLDTWPGLPPYLRGPYPT